MRKQRDRTRLKLSVITALSMTLFIGAAAPESPVADAAQRGEMETVRSLLRSGADVNAAQGDGMTALHWAALNNDAPMAELLIYAGANVSPTTRLGGYTPLHLASREGLDEAVEALLEAGAGANAFTETGATAIHLAAEAGATDVIRTLLERGADVNTPDLFSDRTPLMFATARGRLVAMETLIGAGADISLTTRVVDYGERYVTDRAAQQRRREVMQAALGLTPSRGGGGGGGQQQAATRGQQATPDSAAADTSQAAADTSQAPTAAAGRVEARARQQRREAAAQPRDPDSPTQPTDPATPDSTTDSSTTPPPRPLAYPDLVGQQGGMTALHYAARDGRAEAMRVLLEAGADLNQRTAGDESSPMLVAIINGNYDLAMTLLEMGADPNLASEDGAAPLFAVLNNYWALRTWYPQPTAGGQQQIGYLEVMKALLDAGSDPNARTKTHIWYAAYNAGRMGVDFAGATAFWRAAYALDVAAMRLLIEYGADPNIATTKPASRSRFGFGSPNRQGQSAQDSTEEEDELDPSGLPEVPVGGPAVHPLHAASGVGYGTSRVGQQHRHVPDGWLPAVKYLVDELGVDVDVRDHAGYSAVHNAAARGHNEMIEYLVENGADVTFVSRRGQTTVDMANGPQQRVQPFPETMALLEGLGAVNNDNCQSC